MPSRKLQPSPKMIRSLKTMMLHLVVEAQGAEEYIWQLSTDGGNSWTYLSDVIPYYNTHTSSLTISPAVYSMNGYQYSCRLDNELLHGFFRLQLPWWSTHSLISAHPAAMETCRFTLYLSGIICTSASPVIIGCTLVCVYDPQGMMLYSFEVNQNQWLFAGSGTGPCCIGERALFPEI